MTKLKLEKEMKKREAKNKNVIIRRVVVKKEGMEELREEVEKIVRATGTVGRMEDKESREKEREDMVWVRLASVKEKIEVMKGKVKLRNRREWIMDDMAEKRKRI